MARATRLAFILILALVPLAGRPAAAAPDEGGDGRIRFASTPTVTPDGRRMLFSWRGDLWQASTSGGAATRLTFHPATDASPRVSPDGTRVAFLSNRMGSYQVYVMPIQGGTPARVTTLTEGFALYGWFPEGDALLVRTTLDDDWHRAERFARRPLDPEAKLEVLLPAYGGSGALSPDGRLLAFTREGVGPWRKRYRGSQSSQVWVADLETGTYRRVGARDPGTHGERAPCWLPDGKTLLVASEEDGTYNVYRHDLASGARRRLTDFEDDGILDMTVAPDGSFVLLRRLFDLWRLDLQEGGKPFRLELRDEGDATIDPVLRRTLNRAEEVAFTDDGREIAIVAGGELWVMDTELKEPQPVTRTAAFESSPVFSPDHESLYFVASEGQGQDIWVARKKDAEAFWWQNEAFELQRVTEDGAPKGSLSFTPDGERLAFVKNGGELWTMAPDGSDATRLLDSWNWPSYDFSPDGTWVAYAVDDENFNRDVWIRRADGTGEPFNVSRHPDQDSNPAWSPDGKVLAFTGRRWNDESDVCYVWLSREEEEKDARDHTLAKALEKMKGRKAKAAAQPADRPKEPSSDQTPPDAAPAPAAVGRWAGRILGEDPVPPEGMAFLLVLERAEDGTLTGRIEVQDVFSGVLETLTFDPASGALAFTATTPIGPLTGEGTLEGDAMKGTWRIEGLGSGTWSASREKQEDEADEGRAKEKDADEGAEAKAPEKEKEKEKRPEVVIDFEGLENRIHRIAIPNSQEYRLLWSPDSKKLAFRASVDGQAGLYTVTFPDELQPKRLSTVDGSQARWLKEGNQIVWLVGGTPATLSASGKATSLPFKARHAVGRRERLQAAFDEAWRILGEGYYDERMGNNDWGAIRAKYRPLAGQCVLADELAYVVNAMLGELNGSHLGFSASEGSWSPSGWRDETGHLGLRFDETFTGPGLRVADVVPQTPGARVRHGIEPGDVVLAIDGTEVTPDTNLTRLLTGAPDRDVDLLVRTGEDEPRTVSIRPTSYRAVRARLYDVWLERARARVAESSDGTLGYLHVRGMNWSSFQRFEEELYKAGHGKDGLIIDVRDNGGGFTADHLLTSLTQPVHAYTSVRGGPPGYPQDRMVYARWTKPIVVLCNQNSFSNAEIFAHAIRTLGRGRIVGVPTAGGVISTGGAQVMDVGSIRTPFRGWFLADSGEDMELNGCVPDIVIWPEPGELETGRDRQLDAAVQVLLEDVAAAPTVPTPRPASTRR